MRKAIGTNPRTPLSPAIDTDRFVFVSGQVPTDAQGNVSGGIKEQTEVVLNKIKELLAEAGCSMDQVVKTTVFIVDRQDFQGMNEVYGRFFPEEPPARSCVRAELMLDALVEIEAIALKG